MRYNMFMIVIDRLIWDEKNRAHIARHDVSISEVEEVCHNHPVFISGHSGRLMVIGPSDSGKALFVVLDPKDGKGIWYVVTARSADRKERSLYTTMKGVSL
jgi:uncharacterized DUF497 family protein